MPKRSDIKKVMVIGSGPIIIGQAAEFDYAGTQACKSLREEGVEVVLVNSNPATIMTDENMAEKVYIEPLTVEFVSKIIEKEKPDGLLPTLGGQTGLNLAIELAKAGVLDKYGVKLLGTPLDTIQRAEDREMFKQTMLDLGEPVPASAIVSTIEEAKKVAAEIGYPVIVRPAFTLGGTGGGFASNDKELVDTARRGLKHSLIHQIMLEKSVKGWKEVEYEVIRDGANNCIIICNMENIDPIGIHTGDSIVIAPSQTLADKEYQMLRTASLKIIRALGIEGGCNIQFALDTDSAQYNIIEVNPRVSRSSALASKATGYPIAKVAAKIAIGLNLDEIMNPVTGKTYACFEPTLDYVVAKIPRWPFDKFVGADRQLGTQMKATGEVMAIERSIEGALLKAIRSLEIGLDGLLLPELTNWSNNKIMRELEETDDRRIFIVAEAIRRGISDAEIHAKTKIDFFFLAKIRNIIETEAKVKQELDSSDSDAIKKLLFEVKKLGFSDRTLAKLADKSKEDIMELREQYAVKPSYKMVDTCAAEFEALTPYYYSTYEAEDEVEVTPKEKVVVLGSGPIRIGQGVEFDYCSVHSVWALREQGVEAIIINNNPETVSTDFDTSDKLYFEPLMSEDVINILKKENPKGVVVQFGGQTAINLAAELERNGFHILGTTVKDIDIAEDRKKFEHLLKSLGIPQAEGKTVTSAEEAVGVALKIGFPVVVRPSYVLGGRAMEIVHSEQEILEYMRFAVKVSPGHPVLVDRYISGKEVEVDAISDGQDVLIPGIMEHIERAGVHSGDSMAVFPPQTLSASEKERIIDYTTRIARAIKVKGLLNIQFVIDKGKIYVLEVNPRASRTVPILSKVTGIPMVSLATKIMLGNTIAGMGYKSGLYPEPEFTIVKAPVFSFEKLNDVDVFLSPEMKSTGEIMGIDHKFPLAVYKALVATGLKIPRKNGTVMLTVADKDKDEILALGKKLTSLGFRLVATKGTQKFLESKGLQVEMVNKIGQGMPNVVDVIKSGKIDMVINTPTRGKVPDRNGFQIRRTAVEHKVPCLTSLDTVKALVNAIEAIEKDDGFSCDALQELVTVI